MGLKTGKLYLIFHLLIKISSLYFNFNKLGIISKCNLTESIFNEELQ